MYQYINQEHNEYNTMQVTNTCSLIAGEEPDSLMWTSPVRPRVRMETTSDVLKSP